MATKKKTEDTALQVVNAGALAEFNFEGHEGAGKEQMTAADQAIPFLSVLQALSKAVSDPTKKVAGAAPGMIMDSVTKELYSGDEGILIVPVTTARVYVEWQGEPGSGTVVGRHAPSDPMVVKAKREGSFGKEVSPAGNRLVETFYVLCMILDNADDAVPSGFALFPFTSTKIGKYKESFGVIHGMPDFAGKPLYMHRLRITTQAETRPKGTSFNVTVRPEGAPADMPFKDGVLLRSALILPDGSDQATGIYKLGKQLAEDFANGALNIAYDTEGAHGGDAGSSEDEPY